MRAPESLEQLRSELSTMSPRAQRQILQRLTAPEREALEAPLTPGNSDEMADADPNTLSPWLARAIDDARAARPGAVSPAVRTALIESADAIRRAAESRPERASRVAGRSLVEAFGGLLPMRKGR